MVLVERLPEPVYGYLDPTQPVRHQEIIKQWLWSVVLKERNVPGSEFSDGYL